MKRRTRRREEGVALILAVLVVFVVTVMGIGLMFTTSIEQLLASTDTKISKVLYAADSGIEYAGAMLSNSFNYTGGAMPVGVSSHYPSLSTPDLQVTISQPLLLLYTIRPGDAFESVGAGYGSTQIVENVYAVTSSAASTAIQASKSIDAQIAIYPQQLKVPD
ncbi:MAG TPA: PilX N-terminal domain-containing pilus assembly protein [Thermoanaerobaculia bacterium]|nr:PilX N-terminal domain-containing pilus assembly protein [Thermoanaerobaculia bacterium]